MLCALVKEILDAEMQRLCIDLFPCCLVGEEAGGGAAAPAAELAAAACITV